MKTKEGTGRERERTTGTISGNRRRGPVGGVLVVARRYIKAMKRHECGLSQSLKSLSRKSDMIFCPSLGGGGSFIEFH